jgi:hypothetical protein
MRNIKLTVGLALALAFPLAQAAETVVGAALDGQQVYQCTSTCDAVSEGPAAPVGLFGNNNPIVVPEVEIAGEAPYDATKSVNAFIAEANSDGGGELMVGSELVSTGFDFEAECNAYDGKFWEWRIGKCLEMDPEWKSPGLGKTLKTSSVL